MSDAQWFRSLGSCCSCKRPATGELMGYVNQSLGSYCKKCADKEIKAAHRKGQFAPDGRLTHA